MTSLAGKPRAAALVPRERARPRRERWDARVLVTGAGGFIGANLCRALGARGGTVVAMESARARRWRLAAAAPDVQSERVDLCCGASVMALVRRLRPTLVVNCAAYGAYASQQDAERIYAVNLGGLRHLLDAVQTVGGVRAVVQMGSSSEYGTRCSRPDEDAPAWPDSHYAAAKLAASGLVRLYAVRHRLPAFVLRLYAVYGPYEDASRLIPQLLLHARDGHWPPLARPDISRDFVHVDDVCRAVARLAGAAARLERGSFYNIGTGTCTTLRELVGLTAGLFAVSARPAWGSMPDRAWDHARWFADPSRARAHLGWSPRVALAAGLRRTMAWMAASPATLAQAMQHHVLAGT